MVSMKGLPQFKDLTRTVDERSLRNLVEQEHKVGGGEVQAWWNDFTKKRGHKDMPNMLTPPTGNLKTNKNAIHPDPEINRVREYSLSLPENTTSGLFDACDGCSTKECRLLCNGKSGSYRYQSAENAKQTRGAAFYDNPTYAAAKMVLEVQSAVNHHAFRGEHVGFRGNLWQDHNWTADEGIAPVLIGDFEAPPKNWRGPKEGESVPAVRHSNYTKETMNRLLVAHETGIDTHGYKTYHVAYSTHANTPAGRIDQGLELGHTFAQPVWHEPEVDQFVFEDKTGKRSRSGPAFSGDTYDWRAGDKNVQPSMADGSGAFALLENKIVPNLAKFVGQATPRSFVKPQDPDAPVGGRLGIPSKYASQETKERLGEILGKARRGPSSPISRNHISEQFGIKE